MPAFHLIAVLCAAALAACNPPPAGAVPPVLGGPTAPPAPVFALSCHSASTATSRQVHCIRTDTRSGDVQRVNLEKLPVSNGPTALAAPGPAGRFHTECVAASSEAQSDFYCVRLNTESGELLLVNLTKVPQTP